MAVTIEVELPDAIAEYIKKKVKSGEFLNESAVIEDAVRSKQSQDASQDKKNSDTVVIQYRNPPLDDDG